MTAMRDDVLDGIPAIGDQTLNGIEVVIYAITREEWVTRR